MRKSIIFLIFTAASFLFMIIYCMFYGYISEQLSVTFFDGHKYVMVLWWIPYIIIAVSGVFAGCALFVRGDGKRDSAVIAFMSLAAGIAIVLFTVLAIKMVIKIPFLGGGRTAINWSSSSARPSMVLAGVFIANSFRHFMSLKNYKE